MKQVDKYQNIFVGKKIRRIRQSKGLLQKELAVKIGVAANTISAYEGGKIEIPHSKLLKIAEVLDVKYTEFLPLHVGNEVHDLEDYITQAKEGLSEKEGGFLESLIEKVYTLPEEEREEFLENMRFAVEYFERKGKE